MIYPTIHVDLAPMAKPRMTKQDKWKHRTCVTRYRAWCDELRLKTNGKVPIGVEGITALFVIPMPNSWSKKKKTEHDEKLHKQRPDIDNMCKAIMDALLDEDSGVAILNARKVWGVYGRMELTFHGPNVLPERQWKSTHDPPEIPY